MKVEGTKVAIIFFMLMALIVCEVLAKDIMVPDDFATIQEAIDSATWGDTVLVKPGTYNERILIKEGVSLVSFAGSDGNELVDGPGKKKVLKRAVRTIIDGTGLELPGYLVSFAKDTPAPMKMDGFTIINMPKYVSAIRLFLVEIRGCSPEFVNNIVAKNRSWGGVLSTGLGPGLGPPLETVARPIIKNNVIYGNSGPGNSNGPNSAATVVDNELFDNYFPEATDKDPDAPGIGVREYARPIIENNMCYRNGAGIGGINLVRHEQPLIIRNNMLFDNRRAGIGLRTLRGVKADVRAVIENNEIHGNLKAGVMLSRLSEAEIRNNRISDNGEAGMAFLSISEIQVEDNQIYGNSKAGIRLVDVPTAILRRNRIHDNFLAGVEFVGWETSATGL